MLLVIVFTESSTGTVKAMEPRLCLWIIPEVREYGQK